VLSSAEPTPVTAVSLGSAFAYVNHDNSLAVLDRKSGGVIALIGGASVPIWQPDAEQTR
jgi:hypothetical protein